MLQKIVCQSTPQVPIPARQTRALNGWGGAYRLDVPLHAVGTKVFPPQGTPESVLLWMFPLNEGCGEHNAVVAPGLSALDLYGL